MQSNKMLSISLYAILSRMNTFGVFALSVLYLNQAFSWRPLIMCLFSFVGVSLVICPNIYGFDTAGSPGLQFNGTTTEIIGLLCALGFILTNGFVRTFSSKIANEVSMVQSVFYLNLFLTLFYSPILMFTPIEWKWSELTNYIGISVGTYVYQLLFTDSMRREPDPTVIAIIQTSLIIFTMLIDCFIIGTKLNVYNVIGACMVAVTTAVAMIKK